MNVKINKPIIDLPFFIVVNSESMLWDGYEKEVNTIILNDTNTQELIKVLDKTKAKSMNYCYYICIADNIAAIEGLIELVGFFKQEGFRYYISSEQLEMYKQTMIHAYNQLAKEAV